MSENIEAPKSSPPRPEKPILALLPKAAACRAILDRLMAIGAAEAELKAQHDAEAEPALRQQVGDEQADEMTAEVEAAAAGAQ